MVELAKLEACRREGFRDQIYRGRLICTAAEQDDSAWRQIVSIRRALGIL